MNVAKHHASIKHGPLKHFFWYELKVLLKNLNQIESGIENSLAMSTIARTDYRFGVRLASLDN